MSTVSSRRVSFLKPLLLTLTLLGVPLLLGSCAHTTTSSGETTRAPSRVTRAEALATAQQYAAHRWTPSSKNVLHGAAPDGIRVDTPDVSYRVPGAFPGYWVAGRENVGIPYQWGGFATPEEFDRDIAAGLAAGDVYTSTKRALLDDAVSRGATGIDCSGFISRCWGLPRSFSTRELGALCDALPSYADLQPGDALNVHNSHVLLFSHWLDAGRTRLAAYETGGPPDWKVIRHTHRAESLRTKGYRPLRYRGMRE